MSDPYATDDPGDIEFGCQVWSATHQNSLGYVGGVVIDIDPVARTVTVLGNVYPSQPPDPSVLAMDELQMDLCRFDTANAGVAAAQLFKWLASLVRKKSRSHHDNAKWGAIAVRLQALRDAGPTLPEAEARYQANRNVTHEVSPGAFIEPSQETVDRIAVDVQQRVDAARARLNQDKESA